ncbi:3-keto-5-aminohexanoate cleavage protein [Solemya elarraichensis gill symbiont]|uniref:3-keto-5-aminohexanoate cleavage protein n=1 Tax=Solemya elarraichensis gill symbiont TaxID=1918949 RepID=A0A1T2KVB7_9GAMM|nr:3-keto-5-aminohexanoate cleavage protein [Solemya elarraichensis gill symbiont]OOZ36741.1 hypothetical protein BOW52_10585 [Solemya elarraichensis gill symbiont]
MNTNPLIVNLAPTGMVACKSENSSLPTSPDEIIKDLLQCAELGISIVHLHARDSNENPSSDPKIYAELIERIRSSEHLKNLVVCVSTSGRQTPDVTQRAAVLTLDGNFKPDMASLTLGSLNFIDQASVNSPSSIRYLAEMMLKHDIKPELEIFDSGMINFAKVLIKERLLKPPYYFNLILGNISSAQATLKDLAMLVEALPHDSYWSVGGIGRYQKSMNGIGVGAADGVRVGLEDNLWTDEDRTTIASNYQLLERVHAQAKALGRSVMTPEMLRRNLGLTQTALYPGFAYSDNRSY